MGPAASVAARTTYRTYGRGTTVKSGISSIVGAAALLATLVGAPALGQHAQHNAPAHHTAPAHHAATSHAKITAAQARAAALKKYPGKVEGKINLENEDGKWQYSVNVRSGKTLREVMVDANTGKIASVEVTTKAEEAKETAAEAHEKPHTATTTHHKSGK